MGGYGSGRRGWHGKVEDFLSLDVLRLHREGVLKPGAALAWQWTWGHGSKSSINLAVEFGAVVLNFRHRSYGGEWEPVEQRVRLDWTPCHFGGSMPWFLCPHCGRRVRKIHGGRRFLCRQCHGLVYTSQSETTADRSLRRANKLRRRLGGEPGIRQLIFKPKRMRWGTFNRMVEEIHAREGVSLSMLAKRLGMTGEFRWI